MRSPTLMWVRLVVEDFPSTLRFFSHVMTPIGQPYEGVDVEELGWRRLWDGRERGAELELVARGRAEDRLGAERTFDDVTLVYGVDDVEGWFHALCEQGAEPVLEPRGTPETERLAQVRSPSGQLIELYTFAPAPSFGGPLVLRDE